MPVINGKVARSRYTSLKLSELSSVDNPAQPGALAAILKRHDPAPAAPTGPAASWLATAVAKYVDEDDGAHTFNEVLACNNFDEKIWPMVSALSQSIRSIMGDSSIASADRQGKVQASVDEFLAAVRALEPPADPAEDSPVTKVEKQLRELISKKDDKTMKTVAELVAENPALKAHIDTLTTERDTAKSALETEQTAHATTKAALVTATDEVLNVDGTEIRKSAVGDANFAVNKALLGRAETAELTKRASDEFGHLPGTPAEKAAVLKVLVAQPEETRKAAEAILTAAEKMAAQGFGRLGHSGGDGGEGESDVAKAQATYKGKVSEIAKRDGIQEFEAMRKARSEFPVEFAAAYPEQAAN